MTAQPADEATTDRPYCLRCEVPIYRDEHGVWRREATGVADCPRNPAKDGHEPRPEATTDLTAAEKRDFWQAVCEWNDVPDAFSRDSDSNAILFAAVERIAAERVATALHSAANEAQAPLHVEAWLHARAEAVRRGES